MIESMAQRYIRDTRTGALAAKTRYLLCDTLKVIGDPARGLPPADLGVFYVDETAPPLSPAAPVTPSASACNRACRRTNRRTGSHFCRSATRLCRRVVPLQRFPVPAGRAPPCITESPRHPMNSLSPWSAGACRRPAAASAQAVDAPYSRAPASRKREPYKNL